MIALTLGGIALLAWIAVLLLPWQPYRTRERLEPAPADLESPPTLAGITVLIPARDEADVIAATLAALARQGPDLRVIVVDDQSSDATAEICARAAAALGEPPNDDVPPTRFALAVEVLRGVPLPPGWGGKLWALEQGRERVTTPHTLLLDADIELAPGMLAALARQARETRAALVSIMARLHSGNAAERLLAPAFVYFFKLLYPFARVNAPAAPTAAAAGGCVLVETQVLREIGGFAAIRGALIDDCALAALVKARGDRLWLGLSRSVRSLRRYDLAAFWRMVSRTAFTQLRCSGTLLVAVAALMTAVFLGPFVAPLLDASPAIVAASALAWLAMSASYLPIVRFYALPWAWSLTLPLAAVLFVAMTATSALNYWRGVRARWKDRAYAVSGE